MPGRIVLVIPETWGLPPHGIAPGRYTVTELAILLRQHKDDPQAIQFIADMLEEE